MTGLDQVSLLGSAGGDLVTNLGLSGQISVGNLLNVCLGTEAMVETDRVALH